MMTLNTMRLIGQYMEMMQTLQPIARDVLKGTVVVFEYYLYSVVRVFGGEQVGQPLPIEMPTRLRSTLSRLQAMFERPPAPPGGQGKGSAGAPSSSGSGGSGTAINSSSAASASASGEPKAEYIPLPKVDAFMLGLNDANSLYGAPARIVATESLIYLAEQLKLLKVSE
jgi:hypothetical protein